MDVRAMDTDTARRKKKKGNLPRDIRWRSGEHCECKSPSLWLRLHTNTHIEGVKTTRHLIYGALSAPSNVAIDIRAGGWGCTGAAEMGLRCWNSDLKAESGRSARHRSVRLFHLAIRALFCLERMIVPNACFQSRKHTHMLARTETAREVFLLWWKAGVGLKNKRSHKQFPF